MKFELAQTYRLLFSTPLMTSNCKIRHKWELLASILQKSWLFFSHADTLHLIRSPCCVTLDYNWSITWLIKKQAQGIVIVWETCLDSSITISHVWLKCVPQNMQMVMSFSILLSLHHQLLWVYVMHLHVSFRVSIYQVVRGLTNKYREVSKLRDRIA